MVAVATRKLVIQRTFGRARAWPPELPSASRPITWYRAHCRASSFSTCSSASSSSRRAAVPASASGRLGTRHCFPLDPPQTLQTLARASDETPPPSRRSADAPWLKGCSRPPRFCLLPPPRFRAAARTSDGYSAQRAGVRATPPSRSPARAFFSSSVVL